MDDTEQPTRVPDRKGHQVKCLDLSIITPNISNKVENFNLDIQAEPVEGQTVTKGDQLYIRARPNDHIDLVASRRSDIRPSPINMRAKFAG